MCWLRTELRTELFLRYRPLGPMLVAPAHELRPFCARFVRFLGDQKNQPRPPMPFFVAHSPGDWSCPVFISQKFE